LPGLESKGFQVLEGAYSNWSIYDSFDDADATNSDSYQDAVVNRKETEILLVDSGYILKKYTIATKTLSASLIAGIVQWQWSYLALGIFITSVQQTYAIAKWRTDGVIDRLSIIKDGVVVKTFTNSELGFGTNPIRSASISPSGKYVIASGVRATTGNMGWVVLVGS